MNALSTWLAKASIPHKGGWRGKPRSCKGLFTHIAHLLNLLDDSEATESDERNEKVLQKIIPDLVIDGRNILCAFDGVGTRLFSGCKTLIDVKT